MVDEKNYRSKSDNLTMGVTFYKSTAVMNCIFRKRGSHAGIINRKK